MAEIIYRSGLTRAEVWCGSCLEVPIPADAVAIMDPPYNIGKPQLISDSRRDAKTGKIKLVGQDFGEDFDLEAIQPSAWIPRMPNTVLTFYGARGMTDLVRTFRRNGFEIVQDFHWCKPNAPPPMRGVGFSWATESGYAFRRKGTKHAVNKQAGHSPNFIVVPIYRDRKRAHTTQKPVRVMEWLVRFFSTEETLVVDPFMGSGSTAEACAGLGRKFMGIEQKRKYCDTAIARIKNASQRYRNSFAGKFRNGSHPQRDNVGWNQNKGDDR